MKLIFALFSADDNEIFGPHKSDVSDSRATECGKLPMIFALKYADRKVFMKTGPNSGKNEIHEWLYAIDPLMAGEIK